MKDETILQIAHCEEIEKARENESHPCHNIVCGQSGDFQLPEPWNGDIANAKILFISSNPSIDEKEREIYPTERKNWTDEQIISFYENRFSNAIERGEKFSKYWQRVLTWASWILPNEPTEEIHKKIAITEVVHCKSKREYGVPESDCFCTNKWLCKVLAEFDGDGKYIIVVGKVAKACFGIRNVKAKVAFVSAPRAMGNEKRKASLSKQLQIKID